MRHLASSFAVTLALALFGCGPSGKPANPTPPAGGSADPGTDPSSGSGAGSDAGSADPSAGTPDPNCVCTMQFDPVCGADGKTYSNACQAGCAKVEVKSKGECP